MNFLRSIEYVEHGLMRRVLAVSLSRSMGSGGDEAPSSSCCCTDQDQIYTFKNPNILPTYLVAKLTKNCRELISKKKKMNGRIPSRCHRPS
jgi:hypothetical protein